MRTRYQTNELGVSQILNTQNKAALGSCLKAVCRFTELVG